MGSSVSAIKRAVFIGLKWAWLLAQGAILPLAALELRSRAQTLFPRGPFPQFLLLAAGVVFLVFWLIMQSLLVMYHYPLALWPALRLTAGLYVQNAVIVLSGASWPYASLATLYGTLAAVAFFLALVLGQALLGGGRRLKAGGPLLASAALLCGAGILVVLWPAVASGFSRLSSGGQVLDGLVLAWNGIIMVHQLHRLTIFSQAGRPDAALALEWEKWAGPTIMVLILSAVVAAVLVGLR